MDPPRLSIVLGRGPISIKQKKKKRNDEGVVKDTPYIVVVRFAEDKVVPYHVVTIAVYSADLNLRGKVH